MPPIPGSYAPKLWEPSSTFTPISSTRNRANVPEVPTVDLRALSPLMAKARVLSMTTAQINTLSEEDINFAKEILRRRDNAILGRKDDNELLDSAVRQAKDKRIDYDSDAPLMDNISNFVENVKDGTVEVTKAFGEFLWSPIDTFEGIARAGTGALADAQDYIEEETDFFKPGVISGLKKRRAQDPEFAARRAENQQISGQLGEQISDLGTALQEEPGQVLFRNPVEIGLAAAPFARAAGLGKAASGAGRTAQAARAGLNVLEAPILPIKAGAYVAGKAGGIIGNLGKKGAKALSGMGFEKQDLIRGIAETRIPKPTGGRTVGRPSAMREMDDPRNRLALGTGNVGLQDALKRRVTPRKPLEPGEAPSLIGEGATLQDDIVHSVLRTKDELYAQVIIADREYKRLKKLLKDQRDQAAGRTPDLKDPVPVRDLTMKQDPNLVTPAMELLPPPRSQFGPVDIKGRHYAPSRILNTVDEAGNVIPPAGAAAAAEQSTVRLLRGDPPGAQQPGTRGQAAASEVQAQTVPITTQAVKTAETKLIRYDEISRVMNEIFPSKTATQKLDIPHKVANLTNKGSEFHLNKVMEASDITGIPILPRGIGFSITGGTTSLAGANVSIEAMRQPVTWAIRGALLTGTAGLSTQVGVAALPLLIAVPFTSARVVTRVLQANGWTRRQIKPIVKLTNDVMKIPGIEQFMRTGATYGTLIQDLGISQEDLLRGNNN
jgi:hypothetical protein